MHKMNGICVHCCCEFEPNPRVPDQKYCNKKECRRARRRLWQRKKMSEDPEYKENQQMCWKDWRERHSDYYREYRKKHPEYTNANRAMQKLRDIRRRKNGLDKLLAKMDSLGSRLHRQGGGMFRLIPKDRELLAKMDSLTVELIPL